MKLYFKPTDHRNPDSEEATLLLIEAVDKWGTEDQLRMAQEEAGELIAAINQYLRQRIPLLDVAEEVADVLIMASQVAEIIDRSSPGLVDSLLGQKLHRLRTRLGNKTEPK